LSGKRKYDFRGKRGREGGKCDKKDTWPSYCHRYPLGRGVGKKTYKGKSDCQKHPRFEILPCVDGGNIKKLGRPKKSKNCYTRRAIRGVNQVTRGKKKKKAGKRLQTKKNRGGGRTKRRSGAAP